MRCYQELTRVKTSFLTEDALLSLEREYLTSLKPKVTKPLPSSIHQPRASLVPKAPKLSEDEERLRERWRRLLEMVRKGRAEALASFWEKHAGEMGLEKEEGKGLLPGWLWEEEGAGKERTLLMVAVVANQEEIIRWLLEEKRADPTVPIPSSTSKSTSSSAPPSPPATPSLPAEDDSSAPSTSSSTAFRTAYDLASTREARNVFRRLAHSHPTWWAWTSLSPSGARVPSGLSIEQETEQTAKKTERRKGLKDKMKAREAAKPLPPVVAEVEKPPPLPQAAKEVKGPQRLGGPEVAPQGSLNGLSPELRAKIERERRARAAEARMAGR